MSHKQTLLEIKITAKPLPGGKVFISFNESHIPPGFDKDVHDCMMRIITMAKKELESFKGNLPIQS